MTDPGVLACRWFGHVFVRHYWREWEPFNGGTNDPPSISPDNIGDIFVDDADDCWVVKGQISDICLRCGARDPKWWNALGVDCD